MNELSETDKTLLASIKAKIEQLAGISSNAELNQKDFDFLQGRWLIHHKKLEERLVGCQTWQEFQTPANTSFRIRILIY